VVEKGTLLKQDAFVEQHESSETSGKTTEN
jgi:hypothetical protein